MRPAGLIVLGEFPGTIDSTGDPDTTVRAYWVHHTGVHEARIGEVRSGAGRPVTQAYLGVRRARPAHGEVWSCADLVGSAPERAEGAALPPGAERVLLVQTDGEPSPAEPRVVLEYRYRGHDFAVEG